jgi:hypothetical protein
MKIAIYPREDDIPLNAGFDSREDLGRKPSPGINYPFFI